MCVVVSCDTHAFSIAMKSDAEGLARKWKENANHIFVTGAAASAQSIGVA